MHSRGCWQAGGSRLVARGHKGECPHASSPGLAADYTPATQGVGITNQRETTVVWDKETGTHTPVLPPLSQIQLTFMQAAASAGEGCMPAAPFTAPSLAAPSEPRRAAEVQPRRLMRPPRAAGAPLHNAIVWLDTRTRSARSAGGRPGQCRQRAMSGT